MSKRDPDNFIPPSTNPLRATQSAEQTDPRGTGTTTTTGTATP